VPQASDDSVFASLAGFPAASLQGFKLRSRRTGLFIFASNAFHQLL